MDIIKLSSNERILINNAKNKYIIETKETKVSNSSLINYILKKYLRE
jgi:hypothetical protein